jgi:hypothetical protein
MLSLFEMFRYIRSIIVVILEQLGVVVIIAPWVGKKIKLLYRALSKHVCFFDCPGDIPQRNYFIQSRCSITYLFHICQAGHIPSSNIFFERGRMKKHLSHVRHS